MSRRGYGLWIRQCVIVVIIVIGVGCGIGVGVDTAGGWIGNTIRHYN